MISFKVHKQNGRIKAFECKGHSGYSEGGSDIVCAAVSSAVTLAANTLTDFLCIPCSVKADDAGLVRVIIKSDDDAAQAVAKSLEEHIRQIAGDYPRNIKVIYGGIDND